MYIPDARHDGPPPRLQRQDESVLLEHLMSGYNREVRPVYNASDWVTIEVGITLTQIFDLDEKNQVSHSQLEHVQHGVCDRVFLPQVLTTNIWLDQTWRDELLVWDPADFNNITSIEIPCDKIWLPDIVLYNRWEGSV